MNNESKQKQQFEPCCKATTIGSLPHTDIEYGTSLIFKNTPEIPSWIQFPRRTYLENMMFQFTEGMPGIVEEDKGFHFNTKKADFVDQLTNFFEDYLAIIENNDLEILERFFLSEQYASGFSEFNKQYRTQDTNPKFLKGQVTGPFTLGMNLLDEEKKCSYYNNQLRDMIVKTIVLTITMANKSI